MRSLVLSSFVVVLALMIGSPQVAAQSPDEAAVAQAVEALRKAVISKDRAQFEALLADQLSYWHSDGRLETKAIIITDAMSKRAVYKSIDLTNQTIHLKGDLAIVRHNFTAESEREGKIVETKLGVFMLWQKQDGRWRLLARQALPVLPVPKASGAS